MHFNIILKSNETHLKLSFVRMETLDMCYCSGFKTAEFIGTSLRWYETDVDWLSPVQDKAIASPCEQCKCLSCFVEDGTCWLFRLFAQPNVVLQTVRRRTNKFGTFARYLLAVVWTSWNVIGSNTWLKCCVYGQGFDFGACPLMLFLPEKM